MSQLLEIYLSRITAFIMSIIAILIPNMSQKVELKVTNMITTHSQELHIETKNNTGSSIITGETIVLEKKQDNEWIKVEHDGVSPAFPLIGVIISPFSTYEQTVNIVKVYGDYLTEGEYRITKEYDKTIYSEVFTCSVVFYVY